MNTNTNNSSVTGLDHGNMEALAKQIRKDLNGKDLDLLLWHLLSLRTGIVEAPHGDNATFLPLIGSVPGNGEYLLTAVPMLDFMPRRLIIFPVPFVLGIGDIVVRPDHWVVNDMRCGKCPVITNPGPVAGASFAPEVIEAPSLNWTVLHVGMVFSIMLSHCLPVTCKFMGVLVGETPKVEMGRRKIGQ